MRVAPDHGAGVRCMPFEIHFEDEVLHLTYSGHVTRAEVMESAAEIARLEATLKHRPDQITDLTPIVTRETDYETLSAVSQEWPANYPNSFRMAMVAPTALSHGLARMFQSLVQSPQVEIQIFKLKEEAAAWIASPR